jgi:hypothetical protein
MVFGMKIIHAWSVEWIFFGKSFFETKNIIFKTKILTHPHKHISLAPI